jgi:hypothetical protein
VIKFNLTLACGRLPILEMIDPYILRCYVERLPLGPLATSIAIDQSTASFLVIIDDYRKRSRNLCIVRNHLSLFRSTSDKKRSPSRRGVAGDPRRGADTAGLFQAIAVRIDRSRRS